MGSSTVPPATDLLIVLPHLGPGGAQKVALLAAEHFHRQGHRVALVTLLPGHTLAQRLPDGVPWVDLGPVVAATWSDRSLPARLRRFLRTWLRRLAVWTVLFAAGPALAGLRRGRRAWLVRWLIAGVSGPQAGVLCRQLAACPPRRVLSLLTRTNLLCVQALWDLPTHLVVSERNDPRLQTLPYPWPRLRRLLYRRADVVTANTGGVLEALRHLPRLQRIELLPNPLPDGGQTGRPTGADPSSPDRQPVFLSVARLVPQKGLDVLLEAMALLHASHPGWTLTVVGDGPQRQDLQDRVARLGLEGLVRLEGFRQDPTPYYQQALVFVLPSRFEGMPNALLEAMAAGLAPIVSDASPGPLEVVIHGHSGLVVPTGDPVALAGAMAWLSGDPELRQRLGAAARERLRSLDWPAVEPLWRSVLALPAREFPTRP